MICIKYLNIILGIIIYLFAVICSIYKILNIDFILFLISYIIVGKTVLISAFKAIRNNSLFNEYFLMTIATIGALLLREYAEAVAVMIFYKIGELFENYAVEKSRKSIESLISIRPEKTYVKRDNYLLEVIPSEVKVDEIIVVRAGERIPLDGVINFGNASLDTSALTGESLPKTVGEGDEVLSGMLNLDAELEICVKKTFEDSAFNQIIDMVEMAMIKKTKREHFITKFARIYTPIVVIGAFLLAIIPNIINGFSNWHDWVYRSLIFLVISCPCALVLSVPLSFFGGIGLASQNGILIKGSGFLEKFAEIDTFIFDKTGTLTEGKMSIEKIVSNNVSKEYLMNMIANIEAHSKHPIAQAFINYYKRDINHNIVKNIKEIGGRGIVGEIDNDIVICGNKFLMQENGISIGDDDNDTCIYLAYRGKYLGKVIFRDVVKKEAKITLINLRKMGIKKCIMLTGDKKNIAEEYKELLNLDDTKGDMLPKDKLEYVENMLLNNKVAYVGDGINDAPVIARADIGISMGMLGSQTAISASDIVIMDDKLEKLSYALRISRKTLKIAKQNIVIAIGIKITVLILSLFGLSNLWMGIFADVGVTFIAVLNALRSMYIK